MNGLLDPSEKMGRARAALAETFGFHDFRPGQEETLDALFSGRDVLAVMPTGSGKSLCFQLPALASGGLTLVVSPLIALMRDQVAQLTQAGVNAAALNSSTDIDERRRITRCVADRSLRLLYVAPERVLRDDTLAALQRAKVDLLAIDEAHCVSQWGHDFRPEYLRLREVAQALGDVQTIAVTATADAPTRDDIVHRLFVRQPTVFVRSFDRPNLFLSMTPKANVLRQILARLERHRGQSGIIYCASRKRCEKLAEELCGRGLRAVPYHAGLEQAVRSENQDVFTREEGVIVCATVAFGMGVDKPDVRFVFHADLPSSIESYYQEIGRAGRDGLPADTMTLYGAGDIEVRRRQIAEGDAPPERKAVDERKLEELVGLCETAMCRRQTLLAAFGEDSAPCHNCDVCKGGAKLIDGLVDAQKALSAVLRTSGRFFFGHLANILSGHDTEAVQKHGHNQLKTFGVGADRKPAQWRGVFRQLVAARLVDRDREDRDRIVVTDQGRRVLKGEAPFQLREDIVASAKGARRVKALAEADLDGALLDRLKLVRARLAKAQNCPAYVIFADRSLIDMAAKRPANLHEFADVHGVGAEKLKKYGAVFIAALNGAGDA